MERVYKIKYKLAQKLIDFGYKQLSRFGRWCPVKVNLFYELFYDLMMLNFIHYLINK
jgi:hypothetical protein